MKSDLILLKSLLLFPSTIAFSFSQKDLNEVIKLKDQKKFCESSIKASQCLTSQVHSEIVEKCLVIGEDVTERCVFKYNEAAQKLREAGKSEEAGKFIEGKFKELKIDTSNRFVISGSLYLRYNADYARRHIQEFPGAKSREEVLFWLIGYLHPRDNKWDSYIELFLKEFPKSSKMKLVQCYRAQDFYNRWVYQSVDYDDMRSWPVRKDLTNPEAENFRSKALDSYNAALEGKPDRGVFQYPCYGSKIDAAMKDLKSGKVNDPILFFGSD